VTVTGSPAAFAPVLMNSEAYMTLTKQETAPMAHVARDDRPTDKAARYEEVANEIYAVLAGETNVTARMATVASMLADAFPSFIWTGFYVVDPDKPGELVVGPYQGKLGCLRIPFGKGVCGAAAASGETIIVPDVEAFQRQLMDDIRERMSAGAEGYDPVKLFQPYLRPVLSVERSVRLP
jgi:GAF domain-containing protein